MLLHIFIAVIVTSLIVCDLNGQPTANNPEVGQQLLRKLVCIEHEVCGACLSAASHCRWCADPFFNNEWPRCNEFDSLVALGCSQPLIQKPEQSIWMVEEDNELEDVQVNSKKPAVQLRPQKVRLSLKPRETKIIRFTYRPSKNYPLDLYYLMDLTWTMKDDKETLVSLRDDLPVMLKNLTDNFRLGFGSFVEKPLMPYISTDQHRLANPCTFMEENCVPTYNFHHHLSLTNQVNEFIERVSRSPVSANLDNAEAQLDALVQVIVCGDRIGWAENSRKIIILLSDGLMHMAGDGKLGGAVAKNDEQCHLDDNGFNNASSVFDYPSIAQIYRLLDEYKVNVIFAVTEDVKQHYDNLHRVLDEFTYVAKLERDSSNILNLVKLGYQDIVKIVDFEDDSEKGPLKLKYFTDCGVEGGSLIETTKCTGVEYGMTLKYEVHITFETCSDYHDSTETVIISESHLSQDSLSLAVELQCGCHCDNKYLLRDDITSCPPNSKLTCGLCQCDKGWSGPTCNCSVGDEAISAQLTNQCREPDTYQVCSGSGDCICGVCECDPGYNGKYCQCSKCPTSNSIECGGAERGACACGVCQCEPGWSGNECQCPEATDTCIAPDSTAVCSNRGKCVCGQCQCSEDSLNISDRYTGQYCESCPTCENPLCLRSEACVLMFLEKNSSNPNCALFDVSWAPERKDFEDGTLSWCVFRRSLENSECEYKYTYSRGLNGSVAIKIQSGGCRQFQTASFMSYSLFIIAGTFVIGIIIIAIYRCSQVLSDRRAFAKFKAEAGFSMRALDSKQENPLYKPPISKYTVPEGLTFGH